MKKKIGLKIISLVAVIATVVSLAPVKVIAAVNSNAWSVGVYYDEKVDTSGCAVMAANGYQSTGYYHSFYDCHPTCWVMRGQFDDGSYRMESAIQFYDGHGDYCHIAFNDHGKGGDYATGVYYDYDWYSKKSGYRYAGIKSYNFSGVKLITFAACETASKSDNICKRAQELGAKTTVGWTKTVLTRCFSEWLQRYNAYLCKGYTVNQSAQYADSFTYSDVNVKAHKIYGNKDLKICTANRKKLELLADEVCRKEYKFDYTYDDALFSNMKETIPCFDHNDYIIKKTENDSCTIIDFYKKINGVRTNEGYTAVICNRRVTVYENVEKEVLSTSKNIDTIRNINEISGVNSSYVHLSQLINNNNSNDHRLSIVSQEKIYDTVLKKEVTCYRIESVLKDGGKAVFDYYE